jgi:hypothetical protein
VAEQLARFRGIRELEARHLRRFGRSLALSTFVVDERALVDLDDPKVLQRRKLRPSEVATRERAATQAQAAAIFELPEAPAGLRWWSTLESSWLNVTLFDRGIAAVELTAVRPLELGAAEVRAAAEFLGFR